ncbi:MAG: alpha/beta hydrolase-fold protein [Acidobacteria bacterium]|nr:alpha/beta hydrolase-fold protein [Acidobacteriota bacterium]
MDGTQLPHGIDRRTWLASLSALLPFSSTGAALAQQPVAAPKPLPPPPVKLTPDEQARLDATVARLAELVRGLKAARADAGLVADVEIFHKAGQWLQKFPEEFFTADDVRAAFRVLDLGVERGEQLTRGQSPWLNQPGRRVHGFNSELDGSVQLYGLRVPASYDGTTPVRLYVWLHGRDQKNTEASFIDRELKPGPASSAAGTGEIQLDIYGRWNGMAFHYTGEADVFEAIAQVQKRYQIDPQRILLRGFSMGGCGAWHIALHHPDRFAAAEIGAGTWPRRSQMPGFPPHQQAALRIYENILDWSLNAFNLPIAGHGGENETGLSTIPPLPPGTPTRGQLESSIKVREQLAKEGFPSEGDPYELRAKGTPSVFFISKNTGHSTSPEVRTKLDAFLKLHGDRGIVSPDEIRFVTFTTRYNRSFWVTAELLEKHYERTEIHARRQEGGKRYEISTKNVARLGLRELPAAAVLGIDGKTLRVKGPAVTLEKAKGGWRVAKPLAGLAKRHGLQGPIDDAFLDPFLLVRPTGTPWNDAAHRMALRMLQRFDQQYAKHLRAHPRVKNDTEVTPDDIARYHLVLFGDPGSNTSMPKVLPKLPVKWSKDAIQVGRFSYKPADHLLAMIYPNPLNPNRYVVLNSGLTCPDSEFRGEYQMPRFGDCAVLKAGEKTDFPDFVMATLFDEAWRLPTELA